jgi:ArsR family transcriptional regulator
MSESAGQMLTEEKVLSIAKALGDRRRYEILKRLGECRDATACGVVRSSTRIDAPTLSHHMKELELAGLAMTLLRGYFPSQRCFQPPDLALGAFYHLFPPNQMI